MIYCKKCGRVTWHTTKNRIPRKTKKYHKAHGWKWKYNEKGRVYFYRDYLLGRYDICR